VAASQGQLGRATRLWAVADAVRRAYGMQLPALTYSVTDYEGRLAAVRAELGEVGFEEAWAEGRTMVLEEAFEYALSDEETTLASSQKPDQPLAHEQPPALTQREEEVAALVARGLTNRRIAEELFLSERTVHRHVSNVLKKLGIASREQVAARLADRQPLNTD
jgi:DNA-binding CsgD family transcriptional regulator